MTDSRAIIKDAAKFTLSGYISGFCNFVTAIIVRKILDPFFMGIYTELTLIFQYAKYSHLGMIDALDRQIPYYNGRKEFKKVEEIKSVGIVFSFLMSLVCALGIIIFSLLFKVHLSPLLVIGLKVIAIMVIVQSMSSFYVTLVRTHHLFGSLSKYIILVAVCDIAFKTVLGIKFGIIGILWASVFTFTIGIVYLFKRAGLRFKLTLNLPKQAIRSLLGIGFPLLLAGFTFTVLRSIDRIMIIALLTKEDLGYYSIAIMMYSFIFQLPNLMYTVLFPRFYEAFGSSGGDLNKLGAYLEKPTLAFAYLFPILIGLTVIILPVFVNYILPRYIEGVIPASILLFGTFFISITNMSGYLLVALKRQNILVLIAIIAVIISAVLNLLFVKIFHMGIKGIALGTAITYFLYSVFIISYAIKYYVSGLYGKVKFFVSLYTPFLWVLLIFYLFSFCFHYSCNNLKLDIGNAALQIASFLILTFPLIHCANKKIDLYNRLKKCWI